MVAKREDAPSRPDLYPLEEGEQSGEISDLGARLIKIRERIVASGAPLLDWDDIEREVRGRRGRGGAQPHAAR